MHATPPATQDPDRGCTPVDCAIKYRGRRSFYRNITGKCEPVVECNTRGNDGMTIVAVSQICVNVYVRVRERFLYRFVIFHWLKFYILLLSQYYDWEYNRCTRYDWLEENSFSQIESDTEIPVDLDPSQSKYFPEFEPHLLEKMVGCSPVSFPVHSSQNVYIDEWSGNENSYRAWLHLIVYRYALCWDTTHWMHLCKYRHYFNLGK